MDKVLAEIQRRKELAGYISEGPWATIGDPVSPDTRILVRAGDSTVATVWDDYNNAAFIADCGTHRARELEALIEVRRLVGAMLDYKPQQEWPTDNDLAAMKTLAQTANDSIERAILGDTSGGEG